MDKLDNVIKGLEHCICGKGCYDCPYTDCDSCTPFCKAQIMRDALELLKAQEPQAAVFDMNGYTGEPVPKCPKCRAPIEKCFDYCPSCGQAVKWE